MSTENEVVSQTPVTETNVDEMKTNAKKVMEQAVAASQKRSLDVSSSSTKTISNCSVERCWTIYLLNFNLITSLYYVFFFVFKFIVTVLQLPYLKSSNRRFKCHNASHR